MKTLELLNIMSQPYTMIEIYIENEENILYRDYMYPLWNFLKCCTKYILSTDTKANDIFSNEIKYIRFKNNKLIIVLGEFKEDYRKNGKEENYKSGR